ncbi:MAG: hypothetical protein QOE07_5 [Acidimicrobiaceae bacterium]|nr:hypothetical protein [Acidimicrobiaceae bacterium]
MGFGKSPPSLGSTPPPAFGPAVSRVEIFGPPVGTRLAGFEETLVPFLEPRSIWARCPLTW